MFSEETKMPRNIRPGPMRSKTFSGIVGDFDNEDAVFL
jgi:hypothetical protein